MVQKNNNNKRKKIKNLSYTIVSSKAFLLYWVIKELYAILNTISNLALLNGILELKKKKYWTTANNFCMQHFLTELKPNV